MLAADADRDRAIDVLRAGFAEGRLTRDEHGERVSLVQKSRTYGELAGLTRDLPVGPVPGAVAYPPGTNGTAIAALICGLAGLPVFGLTAIPAIILGHAARQEIRRTGQDGDGMAVAGVVLGWAAIALWTLAFVTVMLVLSARSGGATPASGSLFPGFAG
jgi:hypothetical protein